MQARISAYRPVISTAVRVIVVGLAGIAVLQIWGVGVLDWLEQPVGQRVLGAAVSIALVLVVAVLAWEVASNTIERYLTTQDQDSSDLHRLRAGSNPPSAHAQGAVHLPQPDGPVDLAIGNRRRHRPASKPGRRHRLAIGFGAQKLVQDVITGVFMLVEDALSVGDVVEVAGTGGVVEDMSIRSIRLRDLSGNVHTIPFSSVGTVTNMTKDYSYYLLDIGVDYGRPRPGDGSLPEYSGRDARSRHLHTTSWSRWMCSASISSRNPLSSSRRGSRPGRSSNGRSDASSIAG